MADIVKSPLALELESLVASKSNLTASIAARKADHRAVEAGFAKVTIGEEKDLKEIDDRIAEITKLVEAKKK